jgi:glycyl-tRNA synthetase beta chain
MCIEGAAEKQEDLDVVNTGPAKRVAFDENGELTRAGMGFAKSQGVEATDIEILETPKGEYIAVRKFVEGKETKELLPEMFKDLVTGLTFPKSMRWSDLQIRFARPIQWFLAMADDQLIDFEIEGIRSELKSRGHRFFGEEFEVSSIDEYFATSSRCCALSRLPGGGEFFEDRLQEPLEEPLSIVSVPHSPPQPDTELHPLESVSGGPP